MRCRRQARHPRERLPDLRLRRERRMGLVGNSPRALMEQRQGLLRPCAHGRRAPLRAGLAPHLRATCPTAVASRKGTASPRACAHNTTRRLPPSTRARVLLRRPAARARATHSVGCSATLCCARANPRSMSYPSLLRASTPLCVRMARHTPVCNPFWCTCLLRATRRFVPLRETSPCSARSRHVFGGESLVLRAKKARRVYASAHHVCFTCSRRPWRRCGQTKRNARAP